MFPVSPWPTQSPGQPVAALESNLPRQANNHMSVVIAIANQKGGVGKTTTAVNLGASLAVAEQRTLLIDLDAQANATSAVGLEVVTERSSYELFLESLPAVECIKSRIHFPELDVIPASHRLFGTELALATKEGRETILRRALEPIRDSYDFVLLDCPPSLGLLTLNVLTAADSVIIPIQCEYLALEGISQLLHTVRLVQKHLNRSLDIEGILLTMFDRRTRHANQVAAEAREYFPEKVYRTVIPRNIRVAEAPGFGSPVVCYDAVCKGARAYLELANEVLDRRQMMGDATRPRRDGDKGRGRPSEVRSVP